MDRQHHQVRVGGKNAEQQMLAIILASQSRPWSPNSGERKGRSVRIQREPLRHLELIAGVFAEARGKDQATIGWFQPGPPKRAARIPHVGNRTITQWRRRKAPTHLLHNATAVVAEPDPGGHLIRVNCRF
jgi:hypothetical protein